MPLSTLINSKRALLPLSFLINSVNTEMILNKEGLPTPWPVAIIGGLITLATLISLVTNKDDESSTTDSSARGKELIGTKPKNLVANFLQHEGVKRILIIYSLYNILIPMFGSGNTLRVYGLSGF